MPNGYQRLVACRRTGSEPFHAKGAALGVNLADFWGWSTSDLVSNATRGKVAEFLVACALGLAKRQEVRDEWAPHDLETDEGIRIEVKSAAYLQSWRQSRPSPISFSVRATKKWDPATSQLSKAPLRTADVYVFALLAHQDKASIDPQDVSQWIFFVVPTCELDNRQRSQHSITLKSLQALAGQGVTFDFLPTAVASAFARQKRGKELARLIG